MARREGRRAPPGALPGRRRQPEPEPEPEPSVDVTALLLALADRHAAADPALALRCLDAAAQLGGKLPGPASRRREELAAGLRG